VEELAVPDVANRAVATVPEERLLAFRLVRLEPLPAEGVPISPPEMYKVPV
jgi:hypothetical protein